MTLFHASYSFFCYCFFPPFIIKRKSHHIWIEREKENSCIFCLTQEISACWGRCKKRRTNLSNDNKCYDKLTKNCVNIWKVKWTKSIKMMKKKNRKLPKESKRKFFQAEKVIKCLYKRLYKSIQYIFVRQKRH